MLVLLLSGIGPTDELARHRIPVAAEAFEPFRGSEYLPGDDARSDDAPESLASLEQRRRCDAAKLGFCRAQLQLGSDAIAGCDEQLAESQAHVGGLQGCTDGEPLGDATRRVGMPADAITPVIDTVIVRPDPTNV
jgi:hypothetical protein